MIITEEVNTVTDNDADRVLDELLGDNDCGHRNKEQIQRLSSQQFVWAWRRGQMHKKPQRQERRKGSSIISNTTDDSSRSDSQGSYSEDSSSSSDTKVPWEVQRQSYIEWITTQYYNGRTQTASPKSTVPLTKKPQTDEPLTSLFPPRRIGFSKKPLPTQHLHKTCLQTQQEKKQGKHDVPLPSLPPPRKAPNPKATRDITKSVQPSQKVNLSRRRKPRAPMPPSLRSIPRIGRTRSLSEATARLAQHLNNYTLAQDTGNKTIERLNKQLNSIPSWSGPPSTRFDTDSVDEVEDVIDEGQDERIDYATRNQEQDEADDSPAAPEHDGLLEEALFDSTTAMEPHNQPLPENDDAPLSVDDVGLPCQGRTALLSQATERLAQHLNSYTLTKDTGNETRKYFRNYRSILSSWSGPPSKRVDLDTIEEAATGGNVDYKDDDAVVPCTIEQVDQSGLSRDALLEEGLPGEEERWENPASSYHDGVSGEPALSEDVGLVQYKVNSTRLTTKEEESLFYSSSSKDIGLVHCDLETGMSRNSSSSVVVMAKQETDSCSTSSALSLISKLFPTASSRKGGQFDNMFHHERQRYDNVERQESERSSTLLLSGEPTNTVASFTTASSDTTVEDRSPKCIKVRVCLILATLAMCLLGVGLAFAVAGRGGGGSSDDTMEDMQDPSAEPDNIFFVENQQDPTAEPDNVFFMVSN